MTPRLAFDLESGQIEKLDLHSMVSITDHDNIEAPMLLRTIPSARRIPVSVEWSVPYGGVQDFHLGVHNLPSGRARQWMRTLAEFTANPSEPRLREILVALHDEPNVLVVFNHPMWDLFLVGKEKHGFLVNEFLQKYGAWLHALELNGLRNWEENRAVRRLAQQWNMLLISGGDRHGVEPNANINLTNAASSLSSCMRFAASVSATSSSCRNMPSRGSIACCNPHSMRSATIPIFRRARARGMSVHIIPMQTASCARSARSGRRAVRRFQFNGPSRLCRCWARGRYPVVCASLGATRGSGVSL